MKFFGVFKRRRMRKEFERAVSPELLSLIEHAQPGKFRGLRTELFQFVIVSIDDKKPEEVPEVIAKIVTGLHAHGAILSSIESSVVVAVLGVPFTDTNTPEARAKLVGLLLAENRNRVRITHGECNGLVGNLGTEANCRYGHIIPKFAAILNKLLKSEFGTATEIDLLSESGDAI